MFFAFLSDKIGRKTFYLASTATQAFASGLMAVWIAQGNYQAWLASFLIIGALYGGGFGTLPALASDLFGPKISGATHGVFLSVWAASAVIGIPIFGDFTTRYRTLNATGKSVAAPQAYSEWPLPG